jgi:Tol biopolymer transport system component
MTIDASQAPITRTAFDGNDSSFTRILIVPGGMGGDGIAASRNGESVLWRHREGASGPVSIRIAPYVSLSGQSTNAIGEVLLTDSSDPSAFANGIALSPDGTKYAFTWSAESAGGTDLYIGDTTGTDPIKRLTFSGDDGDTNRAPAFSPNGRFILFDALSDGQYDLWIVDLTTEEVTRLTDTPLTSEANASWSPEGDRIAFQLSGEGNPTNIYVAQLSFRDATDPGANPDSGSGSSTGVGEDLSSLNGRIAFTDIDPDTGKGTIYAINPDRTGLTQITDDDNSNTEPDWSPDGSQLVYNTWGDFETGLILVNADGSGRQRFLDFDHEPAWSPDGSQIAVVSARSGNFEIYVVEVDGSGSTRITDNAALDNTPTWSPDGSQIAFYSLVDGNSEIYVVSADGTGLTRLTETDRDEYNPSWSPDGTKIAFNTDRDIYLMNTDGMDVVQLTDSSSLDIEPEWSPDGNHIAFTSGRNGGTYQIWIMNAGGSNPTQITEGPGEHSQPAWTR